VIRSLRELMSQRPTLVRTLPNVVQLRVEEGDWSRQAAMKDVVPSVRANVADGGRLAEAIAPHRLAETVDCSARRHSRKSN
jgi:hypothetical protein